MNKRSNRWGVGWLAAAVLFAQLLLVFHGIGHAFEEHRADNVGHDDICLECLALAGIHGAPPPLPILPPVVQPAVAAGYEFVLPAPTGAFRIVLSGRDPPLLTLLA